MTTRERLHDYYEFDESIMDAVAEAAEWQNQRSFLELAEQYGLTDGPLPLGHYRPRNQRPFEASGVSRRSLEYIELRPQTDHDETRARLLFTPMGISVDESIAMRAMRLHAAEPTERLVVVGSPAKLGNRNNILRLGDLPHVARGYLDHVVAPALRQLKNMGVKRVSTLGYSYGAETAATAAAEAGKFDLEATHGSWAEPPAVTNRAPWQLLKDFQRSGDVLQRYVDQAESRPLNEARELARDDVRWLGGMGRLSNIAIGAMLSRDGFERRAREALTVQPELHATLAWGTVSEITDNDRMETIVADLRADFPLRVGAIAVDGMHHAGGDDIDLHAAIMLQGLRV